MSARPRDAAINAAINLSEGLERIDAFARVHFEKQLRDMSLAADQIKRQDLRGLDLSLSRVNDAIAHADSFGTLKIKISAETGPIIVKESSDAHFERSILPFLLESKSLILDRIKTLRPEQQLNDLRSDIADRVDDPAARKQIFDIINQRFEEERAAQESLDHEQAQVYIARTEAHEREQRLQIEIRERRWAIYRSFIERESVASIIGALLLVALAAVLIIGMFTHTTIPEIVSSAFLLILGYFFGQTTARSTEQPRGGDTHNLPPQDRVVHEGQTRINI